MKKLPLYLMSEDLISRRYSSERPIATEDSQSFMITRYADIKRVLKDNAHYVANIRVNMLL